MTGCVGVLYHCNTIRKGVMMKKYYVIVPILILFVLGGIFLKKEDKSKKERKPAPQRTETVTLSAEKVFCSDSVSAAEFGWAKDFYGDYAVFGSQKCKTKHELGAAYVFKNVNGKWIEASKLTAEGGSKVSRNNNTDVTFGFSVSIYGDYIAVSDPWSNENGEMSGSVYLYKRDGDNWKKQTMLKTPDRGDGDWFGYAVNLYKDYCVVGSVHDKEDTETWAGAAYIFKRNENDEWNLIKKLKPDAQRMEAFCNSIDMTDEYLALGSIIAPVVNKKCGVVRIYRNNNDEWSFYQKLVPEKYMENDLFGADVVFNDNILAVGSKGRNNYSGAVFVFENTGDKWQQTAEITTSDSWSEDRFGSIYFANGKMFVTADSDDQRGAYSNAVYVFEKDGSDWKEIKKFVSADPVNESIFRLFVNDEWLCISSAHDDEEQRKVSHLKFTKVSDLNL